MENSKKTRNTPSAVKQVAIKAMKPITLCARKIDILQGAIDTKLGAKFEAQKALATEVLRHKSTKKIVIKTEHARLLTYAKGIVAADGLVLHHEKNLWSGVSNLILARLASEKVIKAPAGRDAKGNNVTAKTKVSELPETASSIQKNSSAVRDACGMSDKRKTNTPKKTRAPSGKVSSAPQTHSASTTPKTWGESMVMAFKTVKGTKSLIQGIEDSRLLFEKAGYKVTVEKIKG